LHLPYINTPPLGFYLLPQPQSKKVTPAFFGGLVDRPIDFALRHPPKKTSVFFIDRSAKRLSVVSPSIAASKVYLQVLEPTRERAAIDCSSKCRCAEGRVCLQALEPTRERAAHLFCGEERGTQNLLPIA